MFNEREVRIMDKLTNLVSALLVGVAIGAAAMWQYTTVQLRDAWPDEPPTVVLEPLQVEPMPADHGLDATLRWAEDRYLTVAHLLGECRVERDSARMQAAFERARREVATR
jgi:hypothetical protein